MNRNAKHANNEKGLSIYSRTHFSFRILKRTQLYQPPHKPICEQNNTTPKCHASQKANLLKDLEAEAKSTIINVNLNDENPVREGLFLAIRFR